MKKALKVVFVITDLVMGGTERMLYNVISHLDRDRFQSRVASLIEIGPMGRDLQSLGVPVYALGMTHGTMNPWYIIRLARWLEQDVPDVVVTWLYHADLLGGLAARLAGNIRIVWNLRHGTLDPQCKRSLRWTVRACAKLSHYLPDRIICCSEASRREHAAIGYDVEKMVVIPNGVHSRKFKPDASARFSVRAELGVPVDAPLIGFMARFHPEKDHHTFIEAAARLHPHRPDAHFLLCGENITRGNHQLSAWIRMTGASQCFHLLGMREDMPRLTASLDILTLCSSSEGFPNVLLEAMACGVPCVVTDVGDLARIIGNAGFVVPLKCPDTLSRTWMRVLEAEPSFRTQLGIVGRARVEEHFSLPKIVARYEALLDDIAS
jgi:glycosyltransferase involved in cell wall biosynthesis